MAAAAAAVIVMKAPETTRTASKRCKVTIVFVEQNQRTRNITLIVLI